MAIMDGVLPKYLYRYRAYSDHLIDELSNSYIWFTKAKDLNDPFECNFSLDCKWSDSDLVNYIHTVGQDRGVSKQERDFLLDRYRNDRSLLLKNNRDAIEKLVDSYGFCSFTKKSDIVLMWSYYTWT